MKRLLLMSFVSILATSCSSEKDDNIDTKPSEENKMSLLITDDYNPTTSIETYENDPDFDSIANTYKITKPTLPSKDLRVYFIVKEATEEHKVGDVIKAVDMVIGKNDLTDLPKIKYDIVVTNYKKYQKDGYGYDVEDLEWFKYSDAIENLPVLSDKIYLFSKTAIDYGDVNVAEVKAENHYSLIKHLKYIINFDIEYTYPDNNYDETPTYKLITTETEIDAPVVSTNEVFNQSSNMFSDNSDFYYIYAREEINVRVKKYNISTYHYIPRYSPNIVHKLLTFRYTEQDLRSKYSKDYSFLDSELN